jgi:heme/copper-type cytochrome/quinol oxidase subunit 2
LLFYRVAYLTTPIFLLVTYVNIYNIIRYKKEEENTLNSLLEMRNMTFSTLVLVFPY